MFKVLNYKDFNQELVEQLMEFTYKESTYEIFEDSYLSKIDKENEYEKKKAHEKFKSDYYNFIESFMSSPNDSQFIAVIDKDNKYVSGVRAIKMSELIWFEEALETAVDYRNCGYSTTLIKGLIRHLEGEKCEIIIAHVSKFNIESINLHKKLGFELTSKKVIDENNKYCPNQLQFEYKIKRKLS
ncbi:GNAT family N-acetyltransferase [Helicovermis profundi]|uniref:N-acetyltransferase domain-containing protein n=1 Tax=Helicovermis profundi TaxID=3065157 RepID=A0AAU9EEI7_9FIRM|nr:hypothetical protein HLPR_01590 [Clostridia bacterium S502]BEP29206.1 hypothetical protein HLPR_15370 [Clostridia bacterium S502]